MADEMVPKAVVEMLLQQDTMLQTTTAALQATVERLTAVIEETSQRKPFIVTKESFPLRHPT